MANNSRIVTSATEVLKLLWEQKYFKTLQKISDIEKYLNKLGYNFSDAELGMALKRAKHLTRKGKRGSYQYIQKHPFVLIENSKKKESKK